MDALLARLPQKAMFPVLAMLLIGCTATGFRKDETVEANPNVGKTVQLVEDLARPWGVNPVRVQGVSLVVGLAGTGGDATPSAEREMLLDEMRTRDVDKPSRVLASKDTALVTVQALLPPGIQKGDPVDVEIRTSTRGKVTSLRGGWLMETRLREYARLPNRVASGHIVGLARGDVLVDALFQGDDDNIMLMRGRVLGGGVATKTRNLGLNVRDEHLSVRTAVRIGEAINRRFHIYDRGLQRPVATPKRDSFIELLVHPRYQNNILRYVRVIQSIPVREGEGGLPARLQDLEKELLHAPTADSAALKLEALGEDGVPVLRAGLASQDAEVVFYAAEALAYLNHSDAVAPLTEAIRETAFRWRAFAALGAMNGAKSHDALASLLNDDSAETRYGAFRALRDLLADDPLIRGEVLGSFHYHVLSTRGEPLIHATTSERPELVVFGADQPLQHPVVVYAGGDIVVRSSDDGQISITRFAPGEEDQQLKCPAQLDAVVRSVVDLGGTYPDVVQAIKQAKENGSLTSRVEFAAIPRVGRRYTRRTTAQEDGDNDVGRKSAGKKPLTAAMTQQSQPDDALNPLRDEPDATRSFAPQPQSNPRSPHGDTSAPIAPGDGGHGSDLEDFFDKSQLDEFQADQLNPYELEADAIDPLTELFLPVQSATAPVIDKPSHQAPIVNGTKSPYK